MRLSVRNLGRYSYIVFASETVVFDDYGKPVIKCPTEAEAVEYIQAGRRPCIVISCDKANGKSPVYTVIPGTTKMRKDYIPIHFNIEPSEIKGFLRHTTMFLPEQLVTINEEQIIQTAGMIVSTDAIKKVDAMLVRQLHIGEYDG